MIRRLAVTAAIIAAAICVAAAQLSSARVPPAKAKAVQRQLVKQIKAYAGRGGARVVLPQDNSPCLVCHMNLQDEQIAATHLQQGVTCVLCHGLSYEHRDDENNVTKPDILFGRAEIEPFCRKCHGEHQQPERVQAFKQQWEEEAAAEGRIVTGEPTCTECHGSHTL